MNPSFLYLPFTSKDWHKSNSRKFSWNHRILYYPRATLTIKLLHPCWHTPLECTGADVRPRKGTQEWRTDRVLITQGGKQTLQAAPAHVGSAKKASSPDSCQGLCMSRRHSFCLPGTKLVCNSHRIWLESTWEMGAAFIGSCASQFL